MIRLTWLQVRAQALVGAAALAVVGIVLAITGPGLHHLYATTVSGCHAAGDCATAIPAFVNTDHDLQIVLNVLVLVTPALVGIFWGVPLIAREFETGTYRLAWTQTTRTRWIAIKLAGIAMLSVAFAGVLSLLLTWWSGPFDSVSMSPFITFDTRDLVPLGYAAFAFILGVTAGLVLRRTVPAMAAALVVFVSVRLAVRQWVRPHLLQPVQRTFPDMFASQVTPPGVPPAGAIGVQPPNASDWVLADQTINAKGQVIGSSGSIGYGNSLVAVTKNHGVVLGPGYSCPNITALRGHVPNGQATALLQKCVHQLDIRQVLTYQPVSRYWPLQWSEFAVFVVAAFLLSGFTLWWARRRIG
jgi:hypothetical protein